MCGLQLQHICCLHVCFLHMTALRKTRNEAVSVKPRCCRGITQTSEVLLIVCRGPLWEASFNACSNVLLSAGCCMNSKFIAVCMKIPQHRRHGAVTHIEDGDRSRSGALQAHTLGAPLDSGACWADNTFITSRGCLATRKCIRHIRLLLHPLTDQ